MIGLGACILLLLATGIVGALTVEENKAGGGTQVVQSGSPPVTVPAPPAPPIDLGAVVVPGPPGFDQIPDSSEVASTDAGPRRAIGGPVDIERLVSERGEQARAVFAETRLVNGFVRAFQKPSSSELVTVRLYQFEDAAGATAYATRVIAAMSKAPATTFTVPATDNTTGIDTQVDRGANRLAYVVTRRGRVVAAIAATAAPPPEAGFLSALARAQLSMLP